jgi:hypothetical protein
MRPWHRRLPPRALSNGSGQPSPGYVLILSQIGQSRPAGLKTETLRIGSRAWPPPQRQAPLLLPCKMPVPATHGKAARAGFYLADIVVRPIRSASDNRHHLKYTL